MWFFNDLSGLATSLPQFGHFAMQPFLLEKQNHSHKKG
jgi:hypothetical protein